MEKALTKFKLKAVELSDIALCLKEHIFSNLVDLTLAVRLTDVCIINSGAIGGEVSCFLANWDIH